MAILSFIGLGHMGHPMAKNLLKKGHEVTVYDVVPETAFSLKKYGANIASSIIDAVKNAEVIFTMVQTGKQVQDICLSEEGFFNHAEKNVLYIDCSSIDIGTTRALHKAAEERGISMLDAPVSGGVRGAIDATLAVMAGGSEKNFQRAHPILSAVGKKIIHAGPPGAGGIAKICNNLLLGISMIGVSEAFTLAIKLGLDPKKFYEISSNASGQCWAMTSNCPVPGILENSPASHDYQPGFMAKMMLKDLLLGQNAAESVDAFIPLGKAAAKLYESYVEEGCGEIDFSGIINYINEK
jgi:3-hydroxyisobutyrate dehydrogenase